MIIPYALVCLTYLALSIFIHLRNDTLSGVTIFKSLIAFIIGFHGFEDATGCGNMWFVYTLVLIKIIHHYCSKRQIFSITILGLLISIVLNMHNITLTWAYTNVLLALPFFLLGNFCRYKIDVEKINSNMSYSKRVLLFLATFLLTGVTSFNNGSTMLVSGYYGKSLLFLLLGSVCGITMIWILSMILNKISSLSLKTLSDGTILILAFQMPFVRLVSKLLNMAGMPQYAHHDMVTFVAAIIIMILFLPVSKIVNRYIPAMMGYR